MYTCVDVRQREREKERGIHLAGERTTRNQDCRKRESRSPRGLILVVVVEVVL